MGEVNQAAWKFEKIVVWRNMFPVTEGLCLEMQIEMEWKQ